MFTAASTDHRRFWQNHERKENTKNMNMEQLTNQPRRQPRKQSALIWFPNILLPAEHAHVSFQLCHVLTIIFLALRRSCHRILSMAFSDRFPNIMHV